MSGSDSTRSLWEIVTCEQGNLGGTDGGWPCSSRKKMAAEPRKYGPLETFRQFSILVGVYGLNRGHAAQSVPAKVKTAEFWLGPTISADPASPSSHLATGMAMRAFAVRPAYEGAAQGGS